MHTYFLGPYTLSSAFEFPELAEFKPDSDYTISKVTLREGKVSLELEAVTEVVDWCFSSDQYTLLIFSGVGRFLIDNTFNITVQLEDTAKDTGDWRAYFLGSVLNILCFKSRYLAIHASALVLDGHAILLGGDSGHGKSTIAAALRKAGLQVLSDDLSIIVPDADGQPVVYPCYPTARLWSDTLEYFQTSSDNLEHVHHSADKFLVPTREEFYYKPVSVSRVYQLNKAADDTLFHLEKKSGLDAITTLIALTHRNFLLPGLGYEKTNFQQCSDFATSIDIYSLIRLWGLENLEYTANAIIQEGAPHKEIT